MTTKKLNKQIRQENKKLVKLEKRLVKATRNKVTPLSLKDIKIEVAKQRCRTYRLISQKLGQTDDVYGAMAEEQCKKYADNLVFKKYKESVGIIFSAVNVFDGHINSNGHMYCTGDFTFRTSLFSVLCPILFNIIYPKRMQGSVDCLGNISLKVTGFGLALFNTMPEEFDARILPDGTISLKTKTRSSDIFQNHRYNVRKILSSFAFSSSEDMALFQKNKDKLVERIEEERTKL